MVPNRLEWEKFMFEKEKSAKEFQLKEREIVIKENEILNSRSRITSTQVTILVAIFGIVGTLFGAWLQGYSNRKLERLKFESEIILKVATSDSIAQNKKNLKFLLDAGFISDDHGRINNLVNDSSFDLKIGQTRSYPTTFKEKYFQFYNTPLTEVLLEIAKYYGISSYYPTDVEFINITIDKASRDLPITEVLKLIEKSSGLSCKIIDNVIVVFPLSKVYVCTSSPSSVYHRKLCNVLKACAQKIDSITTNQAIEFLHKKPCKYCYKLPN